MILALDTDVLVAWNMEGAHRLGRKRLLDTALAATLEAAGVERLATLNGRDYQVFGFIEVVEPS